MNHRRENCWLNVVLWQPEIPPNTGNVIRLCANTGAALHLVAPLGFDLEEKKLRRAGLDYREFARVQVHDKLDDALAGVDPARRFAMTTRARRGAFEVSFRTGDALIFGPETRGLPDEVLSEFPPEQRLRLPMRADSRSLNLSNAVAVTVYESWRQLGFPGAVRRR